MIRLSGTLTCPPERRQAVRAALPRHIELSRAEPGCLTFEVHETHPGTFAVSETFTDRAAFDAHQSRTRDSDWAQITQGLPRAYSLAEE